MIPVRDSVPRRHPPLMIWTLIAVNGLVFWIELGLSEREVEALFYQFGLVPARYSHPEWAVWIRCFGQVHPPAARPHSK